MNKEYNIKDSLQSGDIGVSLMQFLAEHNKGTSVLGTQEEDRKLKIDMYINDKPCQVKTDYQSQLTRHVAIELAEINFDLKREQFGGDRPGSIGVPTKDGGQIIAPLPTPNVTAGALLQQPLLDNCSNLVYIMIGVGIVFYDPKVLNTALWYWLKNHIGQDIENDRTWSIQPAQNPNYISLSLLMPYKYLIREQIVTKKKGYGSQPAETYTVEPFKFIPWAEVQNLIITEDKNKYWPNMIDNVNKYINHQYNTKKSKQLVEDAFGLQLLHKSVY